MFVSVKMLTDSHTHLYLDAFDRDRDQVIERAVHAGITRMLLPNIDRASIAPMLAMAERFPDHCFPMMALHPTSVKADYREELKHIEGTLQQKGVIAVGETGIDLYWDKTYQREQEDAFAIQIGWAMERDLPLVIHARESFPEIFSVLDSAGGRGLRGVFHSFTGGMKELEQALSYDFMIGINGIVTFKNSGMDQVVRHIPADRLLLETDAPFLAPVPYRGKRNESSYLLHTAEKVAEIFNLTVEEIAAITTANAELLFRLKSRNEI
jgi:TatD DNase family protein